MIVTRKGDHELWDMTRAAQERDRERRSKLKPARCRYAEHRGSDYEAAGGRLVCGICHPPRRDEG